MATPAELVQFAKAAAEATAAQQYCLLWIDWWPLCMDKSQWASWAQVVGAVGAILGAFWVANRQTKEQRRLADESARAQLRDKEEQLAERIRQEAQQRAADEERKKTEHEDKLLEAHRRVFRAAIEFGALLNDARQMAHMLPRARLFPREAFDDLKARLRHLQEGELTDALEEVIAMLRQQMSQLYADQFRHNDQQSAEAWLAEAGGTASGLSMQARQALDLYEGQIGRFRIEQVGPNEWKLPPRPWG